MTASRVGGGGVRMQVLVWAAACCCECFCLPQEAVAGCCCSASGLAGRVAVLCSWGLAPSLMVPARCIPCPGTALNQVVVRRHSTQWSGSPLAETILAHALTHPTVAPPACCPAGRRLQKVAEIGQSGKFRLGNSGNTQQREEPGPNGALLGCLANS
jgi:hypothetical protein